MCEDYWFNYCFDDLFEFEGSYSAAREELGGEGVLYLHYGDMHTSSRNFVDVDNESENLPRYKIKGTPKFLLNDGDLVFVDASEDYPGTCKTFLVKNKTNKPFVAGLHTFIARSKVDVVSNEFKKYLTEIPEVRKQIYKYVQGYKVYGINRDNLKKINVCLPNYDESLKIAKVLDCWARAVELQEQKVEKLKEKKKSLMQKLLTPKDDWCDVRFIDICDCYQSQTIPQNQFLEAGFKVYGANGVIGYYDKYNHENWQVVLSCRGNCGSVNRTEDRSWINGNAMVLNLKNEDIIDKNYFYYQCLATSFDEVIDDSGIPQITCTSVKNKVFRFVKDKTKQKCYADFFRTIDKKITLEENLLLNYKEQQKALMQKLLTGEIRFDG